MDYPQKYKGLGLSGHFIELAKKAKAEKEPWVQKALFALGITENEKLARALAMHLKILAILEELDPYPFATPSEEDFE